MAKELGHDVDPGLLIPLELSVDLLSKLPLVSDGYRGLATLVTIGEDGPGLPASHSWSDILLDPLGTAADKISYAAATKIHQAWQSALDNGAARTFLTTGDIGPLQDRALKSYRHSVNEGYDVGLQRLAKGTLPIYSADMPENVAMGIFG